ncbi:MAG TPA: hypothetical protein VFQ65_00560 [Kofleriaceae bacterium]|nr:hypothetical protein [Kofleriaceae bacterium]
MTRFAAIACLLAGCLDSELAADQSSLELPRGAGIDLHLTLGDQPVVLDEVSWLVDDPSIVTVARTSDGAELRVAGAREGETAVHFGTRGRVIDLPAHVAPPAIVQLWIEPVSLEVPLGATVDVRATAMDTTSTLRDVSDATTWQLMDPGVARLDDTTVVGATAGSTTLQAVLAGVHASAAVTVY